MRLVLWCPIPPIPLILGETNGDNGAIGAVVVLLLLFRIPDCGPLERMGENGAKIPGEVVVAPNPAPPERMVSTLKFALIGAKVDLGWR